MKEEIESKLQLPNGLFNWLAMHKGMIAFDTPNEWKDKHIFQTITISVQPRFMHERSVFTFNIVDWDMENQRSFNAQIFSFVHKVDKEILDFVEDEG